MERFATADVRALPLMKSGSTSTLNERGVITKDTMCAKRIAFAKRQVLHVCPMVSQTSRRNWQSLEVSPSRMRSRVLVFFMLHPVRRTSVRSVDSRRQRTVKHQFRSTLLGTSGRRELSDILQLEADNSSYEDDAVKDTAPFEAGLIVIGEGRCVNSKNPLVGSERGLSQIDSKTEAIAQVSEETGSGDDKNHCIESAGSKLGRQFLMTPQTARSMFRRSSLEMVPARKTGRHRGGR